MLVSVLASYATEKTVTVWRFLGSLTVLRPVNPSLVQINMLTKDKNLLFLSAVISKVAELAKPVAPLCGIHDSRTTERSIRQGEGHASHHVVGHLVGI